MKSDEYLFWLWTYLKWENLLRETKISFLIKKCIQNLDKKMKWKFLLIKNSIQNEHGYLWWCKYEKLNDSIGWLIIEMINNQVSEENEYISWWYILAWQIDESSIERFDYDK